MSGHVQDRWYKTVKDKNGKPKRARSARYGKGMRYRARYIGPDGSEQSQSFPDRQKRRAENWLRDLNTDMSRGQFIDPKAARITFQQYAERWLKSYSGDPGTRASAESRLRRHAFPYLGSRPLDSFQPSHIREWLAELADADVTGAYALAIFSCVRTVMNAAVDDVLMAKNPCAARSVKAPVVETKRIVPWTTEQVFAIRAALSERYQAMVDVGAGCGLRQGEILGLAEESLLFDKETVHVDVQIKLVRGKAVFAPPKGGKLRDVPLSDPVADALKAHMKQFPPVAVTLPWKVPGGRPVTRLLLFTTNRGNHVWRHRFNSGQWKPALAVAGIIPELEEGVRTHGEARSDGMHAMRHFYASVLLDAGENIKVLAEHLGHGDASITLKVYTHLMPSSRNRTRKAIAALYPDPKPPSEPS